MTLLRPLLLLLLLLTATSLAASVVDKPSTEFGDLPADVRHVISTFLSPLDKVSMLLTEKANREPFEVLSQDDHQPDLEARLKISTPQELSNPEAQEAHMRKILGELFEASIIEDNVSRFLNLFGLVDEKAHSDGLFTAIRHRKRFPLRKLLRTGNLPSGITCLSILDIAVTKNDSEVVEMLLSDKFLLELLNKESYHKKFQGKDELLFACQSNFPNTVAVLLKVGQVDPATDNFKAFRLALKAGHREIVQEFLDSGKLPVEIFDSMDVHPDLQEMVDQVVRSKKQKWSRLRWKAGVSRIFSFGTSALEGIC